MFFCTVYACIYVVVLLRNVVVNVSERFERCWDSNVLLSHAEIFPQSSFSLMFRLVLMKLVVGSVISPFYYLRARAIALHGSIRFLPWHKELEDATSSSCHMLA